jgi:polysaccharide biosynthesis/export protein
MRVQQLLIALIAMAVTGAQPVAAQNTFAPVPAPAPTAAPPAATSTDGYQIGAEDVLEVDVLGQGDFKSRVKVKSDGSIPLPYLGNVQAAGYTAITLAQSVVSRLKTAGIFSDPVVNVEVVSYASRYVLALGEVGGAGIVPVDRAYRLSEILARIGGIKSSGTNYIILTRPGQAGMKFMFENLARGSEQDDPLVQPGDKIYVPKAELYYMSGAISSPGEFTLNEALTIRKAIARAGGVKPEGSINKVKIFREGREIKRVNLETLVQPGDSIVIGERLF